MFYSRFYRSKESIFAWRQKISGGLFNLHIMQHEMKRLSMIESHHAMEEMRAHPADGTKRRPSLAVLDFRLFSWECHAFSPLLGDYHSTNELQQKLREFALPHCLESESDIRTPTEGISPLTSNTDLSLLRLDSNCPETGQSPRDIHRRRQAPLETPTEKQDPLPTQPNRHQSRA